MKKINRLIKTRKHFMVIASVVFIIYIALFFVALLLSTPYPILTLIIIASAAPGCWLIVRGLFKWIVNLHNKINKLLTNTIKQNLHKEFAANNLNCLFDIVVEGTTGKFILYHPYSEAEFDKLYRPTLCKIRNKVNTELPSWHNIVILPVENKNLSSSIIV